MIMAPTLQRGRRLIQAAVILEDEPQRSRQRACPKLSADSTDYAAARKSEQSVDDRRRDESVCYSYRTALIRSRKTFSRICCGTVRRSSTGRLASSRVIAFGTLAMNETGSLAVRTKK